MAFVYLVQRKRQKVKRLSCLRRPSVLLDALVDIQSITYRRHTVSQNGDEVKPDESQRHRPANHGRFRAHQPHSPASLCINIPARHARYARCATRCTAMHRARWCTGHIRLWHFHVGQLNFSPLPLPCPDRDKSTAQRSLPSSLINTTAPPTGQNSLTCTRFSLTGPLYLPPPPSPSTQTRPKKGRYLPRNPQSPIRNRNPQPQPAPTLPTPACTYLSGQPNQPKTSQPLTVLGDPRHLLQPNSQPGT